MYKISLNIYKNCKGYNFGKSVQEGEFDILNM